MLPSEKILWLAYIIFYVCLFLYLSRQTTDMCGVGLKSDIGRMTKHTLIREIRLSANKLDLKQAQVFRCRDEPVQFVGLSCFEQVKDFHFDLLAFLYF